MALQGLRQLRGAVGFDVDDGQPPRAEGEQRPRHGRARAAGPEHDHAIERARPARPSVKPRRKPEPSVL